METKSPLDGGPPLTENEQRFWCEAYLAFMRLPAHYTMQTARGIAITSPDVFADTAVASLRVRCAPRDVVG
jgi:hypothetical protein